MLVRQLTLSSIIPPFPSLSLLPNMCVSMYLFTISASRRLSLPRPSLSISLYLAISLSLSLSPSLSPSLHISLSLSLSLSLYLSLPLSLPPSLSLSLSISPPLSLSLSLSLSPNRLCLSLSYVYHYTILKIIYIKKPPKMCCFLRRRFWSAKI